MPEIFIPIMPLTPTHTHKQIQIVRNAHSVITFSSTMCTLQVYKNLYFNKNAFLLQGLFNLQILAISLTQKI
jgi:hypothetical protein